MTNRTGWNVRAVGLAAALVLALAGCGDSDDVSDLPGVPDTTSGGGDLALMGEPVDACALFTADDFTAVIKKPVGKTESLDPSGSLLGDCTHMDEDITVSVGISVRPAKHFAETVERYDGEKLGGVGESAYWGDKLGLFVQPAGQPYFLHIIVIPDVGKAFEFDKDLAIEVAKVAASR